MLRNQITKLRQRRKSTLGDVSPDLVNSTSASVRVLLDPATIEVVELHPGLFPLFRRLQINLAVLLQLGQCTPEKMLRISALLIGIKPTTSPDKIQKILAKALDQVRRAGQGSRFSKHPSPYQKYVGLYEEWWAAGWYCSQHRIDILDDIITDMRRHIAPLQQPNGGIQKNFRAKYGGAQPHLHYGFTLTEGQEAQFEHPMNALTVGPALGRDYDENPQVHSTVHSSTPVRYEFGNMDSASLFPSRLNPRQAPHLPRIQDTHLFSPPSQRSNLAGPLAGPKRSASGVRGLDLMDSADRLAMGIGATSDSQQEGAPTTNQNHMHTQHPQMPMQTQTTAPPPPPPPPPLPKMSTRKKIAQMLLPGKRRKESVQKDGGKRKDSNTNSPVFLPHLKVSSVCEDGSDTEQRSAKLRQMQLKAKTDSSDEPMTRTMFRRPSLPY